MNAKEWLALNDPTYVKPTEKAAKTRKIAFSREAIEALSGSAVRKVGGRYVQCSPMAFVGGEDYSIEPTYDATQEQDIQQVQTKSNVLTHRSHGKGNHKAKRRALRLARKNKYKVAKGFC